MAVNRWISVLRRLLQLWRLYAAMDLMWVTRVPKLFFTYYFSDGLLNIALITATLLLAERFDGIGPWNKQQIVFMLGYATIVTGIVETFFGYNVLVISRRLGRGQLDHLMIQPQPLWLALLTEGFLPFSGSSILLPGFGLLIWATRQMALAISPGWLLLLVVNILASAAVVLAFSYLWGCLAFWAPRAAEEISSSSLQLLQQLKSFPLDGLAIGLIGGLLTFLPVGFVAWYPCRYLLGITQAPWAGVVTPLAAIGLATLAVLGFRQGLKHYGRTGSQRYLGFGHRS